MMADNERLGINKVRFVMDRGFFSKGNVKFMASQGYPFIIAIPSHFKVARDVIDKYGEEVKRSRYHIEKTGVKALSVENLDYDIRTRIHLFCGEGCR
jgi:transposase